MRSRISAAVLAGVTLALACGVGSASASDLTVRPRSVPPAGKVTVDGTCPDPVGDSYTSATVGIDSLGRYAFVPVATDGTFHATVHVKPQGAAEKAEAGDTVTVVASCRTAAAFVAPVGTSKVRVVDRVVDASRTHAVSVAGSETAGSTDSTSSTSASSSDDGDGSVPARVPLIAFAVAVVGTLGAYALSRRSDRRAAAMTGHPAQRGVGRDEARDRK